MGKLIIEMIDNLGIGVVTSTNLKNRYTACKNTWAKDFKNVFFFGGNIPDDNLIGIKQAGEDYNSHFLKQQLGFKYMYEHNPNYDWYCMTSCDAMLFKNSTINEIYKFNHNEDILLGQPCGNWTDVPYIHEVGDQTMDFHGDRNIFKSIAGGGGFFVSNSLMKKCYKIIDKFNNHWTKISGINYTNSDVAFAYMIYKYFNIRITHIPYILSQPPSHFEGAISGDGNSKYYLNYPISLLEIIKNPISFHYIKPNEMEEIYNKYR